VQPPGRCPRCGYPLRYDERGYSCGFCGYPNAKPPIVYSIRNLEHNLRSRLQALLDSKGRQYERMSVHYPSYSRPMTNCLSCGLRIPSGLQVCPYCGAPTNIPPPRPERPPSTAPVAPNDQQVLDYIAAHNGTISLSQAAKDLATTTETLRTAIERLKTLGFLKQA
jgi:hypothetical protein